MSKFTTVSDGVLVTDNGVHSTPFPISPPSVTDSFNLDPAPSELGQFV